MTILFEEDLSDVIKHMLMRGGVLTLISPYISDFKGWGDTKGTKIANERNYLTEILINSSLSEDGRIIIITDSDSKNRFYSKGIIEEIKKRKDALWIYVYEIDKLHAKLFFNSRMAVVGSSNLTFPALKKNIELGVWTDSDEDLLELRIFIGELIIKADGLNKQAILLKENLEKHGLLKKEVIFDIIELIAHSHYLYRTTKIQCIWHSLKEPKILSRLADVLDKFDDERKNIDKDLSTVYSPIPTKDSLFKKYREEELRIKEKEIEDILHLWKKYLSGEISKPTNIKEFFIHYKNPIKLPNQDVGYVDMNKISAMLIEKRMNYPISKLKK